MQLREFMRAPVYTCAPSATLATVAHEMEAHNVGSLIVIDKDAIVGILTDRDLALSFAHGHSGATEVEKIMSHQVVSVPETADIDTAAGAMDSHGVRRLPVLDASGKAIGIICLDDLYRYLTQETLTLAGVVKAQGAPQA